MLKTPFLRNIFLISLALVLVVPLYEQFYIHPAYRQLLTAESEADAVRFVSYLVRTLQLEGQSLVKENLPAEIADEARAIMGDAQMVKLRVFSPDGEIVYSTQSDEVGTINDMLYFRQLVARGRLYSKVVKKDRTTADGDRAQRDVVETYVPVMTPSGFGGAIEVYYDVTDSRAEIAQLNRNSSAVLTVFCLCLLGLLLLALRKAQRFLADQLTAEAELKSAKENLEFKVHERTGQLLQKNQQLTDEIAEKTLTQMALKSALAETQAGKEKIDGILQSVTDGLLVVDSELRIALVNPALEVLFGISAQQMVGKTMSEVFNNSAAAERIRLAFAERDESPVFDLQVEGRVYLGRLSPVYNEARCETATILLLQDVTQARELDQLKSDFLAMAAHELHTPITTIMGYTELLGSDHGETFSPEHKQEFLNIIHQKAEALAKIVDDLLDISRMEAGQVLNLRMVAFDLRAELEKQLEQFRLDFPQHQFHAEAVASGLILTADLLRFGQLMQNLLSNAVKYAPDGGPIELAAERFPEEIRISVRDAGIGMTPEQVNRAFERFYRADSSMTAIAGTGLGLSIVRNIIVAHGGRIWIDSRPGQGTTVHCCFPSPAPPAA
jgi:PAS domain S-box-containing protein